MPTALCFGSTRKVRTRVLACVDILLALASLFLWVPLVIQASSFYSQHWNFRRISPSTITSVQWHCGQHFFLLYTPADLGNALGKSVVFFVLSSVGYLISGLFLVYATVSSEDSAKILLATFLTSQVPLIGLSISAIVFFHADILCFFEHDGLPEDTGRQGFLLLASLAFLLLYKPFELIQVLFYWRHLSRKVYPPPVNWMQMSPYETAGRPGPPPGSPSMHSISSDSEVSEDDHTNEETKKNSQKKQEEDSLKNNNNEVPISNSTAIHMSLNSPSAHTYSSPVYPTNLYSQY